MSYSHKQMEALCLDLADKADPLEASALREVAQNYKEAEEPKPKGFELSFRHIILIAAAIYAVWTPIYFFGNRTTVDRTPDGKRVEQLSGFVRTSDGRWTTRTYRFAPREDFSSGVRKFVFTENATPVVYEGMARLPKTDYEIQELNQANIWRFVTIKTGDGSDPNKNGKRYYIALP